MQMEGKGSLIYKKKIAIASEVLGGQKNNGNKRFHINDSAYVLTKRDHALPIDEYGKCNYYLKSHNHIHIRLIRKTIELLSDNLPYNGLYN